MAGARWTEEQIEYVLENWENTEVSTDVIVLFIGKNYKAISNKARQLGLNRKNKMLFSKEDFEILKIVYPIMSTGDIVELYFVDKSRRQVEGFANSKGLLKDKDFLSELRIKVGRESMNKINKEHAFKGENHPNWSERISIKCDNCGKLMYRTHSCINNTNFCDFKCKSDYQRYKFKNSDNPNWKGGISTISEYLRSNIKDWKNTTKVLNGYKCFISDGRFEKIHHIHGFNMIVEDTISSLDFKYSSFINEVEDIIKKDILIKFKEIHSSYGLGVCLSKEIHDDFHLKYGIGNNTKEQFIEYCDKYHGIDFEDKWNKLNQKGETDYYGYKRGNKN